jgi:hypothetical protein
MDGHIRIVGGSPNFLKLAGIIDPTLAREYSRIEGTQNLVWRSKTGLETPIFGRYAKENTRLIFAPPRWYDLLVLLCIGGGSFLFLGSFLFASIGIFNYLGGVATFTGLAVLLAGVWGALSNERLVCDLRNKTYARLEGQGFFKRVSKGSLQELQGIVLMSQQIQIPGLSGLPVVYRLVLYWKHSKEPLLVLARDERSIGAGQPINVAAGTIAQFGHHYAQHLGIPFYDNSHVNSAGPLAAI